MLSFLIFKSFILLWVFLLSNQIVSGKGFRQLGHIHCYECQTLTEGERCNKLDKNHTRIRQCPINHHCMARRYSYTINGTHFRLWHMERNCSSSCQEYCIMMGVGERTKIIECTSCCAEDLCNTGSGAETVVFEANVLLPCIILIYRFLTA